MVLTMKLTSFAYNIYDGMVDTENVFKKTHEPRDARTYASRRHFALTSLPNPLQFFGYVYCFTCILAGPAFEYKDYLESVEGTSFQVEDKLKGEKMVKKPANVLAALQR